MQVDELSIIDASELAVNSMPAICENPRIQSQLGKLSNADLTTRLIVRQELPQMSKKPLAVVAHFDDSHPLEDEDCIIPEDQEAQLEAQDGWGVLAQKQKSDSQLIAENGSEPESQGVGTQLPLGVAPVRVEATEQSQGGDNGDDDESVSDSQGFHFQHEDIEATFVQCSDTESEEESRIRASVHASQDNAAATTTTSSQVAVSTATATTTDEVTAQVVATLSASPASTPKKKRFKVKKNNKMQPSQQSTQSDAELPRDAEELASDAEREETSVKDPIGGSGFPQTQAQDSQEGFAEPKDTTTDPNESLTQMSEENAMQVDDAERQMETSAILDNEKEAAALDVAVQERGADDLTQEVDHLAESQDVSDSVFVHDAESQNGPLTQAPGDYSMIANTQEELNATEAEADGESSQVERSGSFGVMDDDMWHTQPNEDSQVFGFAGQSQSERESGGGLQSIQSFIDVEPPQPLARVAKASENTDEPEFGADDSFTGDEENRRVLGNESQPDSDDHQQSENLLSPKVARKQAESESANQQSDQFVRKPRLDREARVTGSPAGSKSPTQSEAVDLTSPAHTDRALLSSTGQKRNQKRPLDSVTPDHPSGCLPATAEVSVSLNVLRHRKALRRTDNLSPHQPSNRGTSVSVPLRLGSGHAHYQGVPLSIQQRALQLHDDPLMATSGGTGCSDANCGEPRSLLTLLHQLQHREATQQSTNSLSSRRRANAPSSSGAIAADIRPSKRYEHLFPPLRMDDLDTMILERFGKSK